jgi:hypothetical protein
MRTKRNRVTRLKPVTKLVDLAIQSREFNGVHYRGARGQAGAVVYVNKRVQGTVLNATVRVASSLLEIGEGYVQQKKKDQE